MATINDVARRAAVSISTVSRVLNGTPNVDPELSRRVRAAAVELGYRPNSLGRNLRRQMTAVWTLIIADVESPFFTSVARGVEDIANEHGYSVVLGNSDEDPRKERGYLDVAFDERSAGVVIAPTRTTTDVSLLVANQVPVVAIDRSLPDANIDTVLVESRQAAAAAVRHLLEEGWNQVTCITGPMGVPTADERLQGWREALRDAGRANGPELVWHADYRVAGGYEAVCGVLDQPTPPDALFVANNLMGVGALQAVAERDLVPGRDLGLVVFDDEPWMRFGHPSITAVAQPTREIGHVAGELLLERIRDPRRAAQQRTLEGQLMIRESSRRQA